MKKYKPLLFLLFLISLKTSVTGQETFEKANELYIEEHYKTAAKSYEQLLDSSHQNAEIYYNLGNAYYKSKRIGLAIWAYEKSLKINPKNEDAKFNLEFVNLQTEDKIEQPNPAISEWLKRLLFGDSINLWAFVSIASSLLLSLTILIFMVSKSRKLRNISMMSGLIFGILLLFSTTTAYFHKQSILDNSKAIIVKEKVEIRISPLKKANVSFELHEGAKIQILQENENWLQIEVNGNTGWVEQEDVMRI